ncbi:MAG: integration host factor subunit beta [Alphaproteobacteria bacterium]|nr:integration host factor subunit beta [Alphaproteobacteria bacterium]
MTKSELISKIAQKNPNLTLKEVEKIVSVVFAEIVDALSAGHRVEFRGFGAFSVRSRAPRTAKNPKTGTQVQIGERHIVHFKTGKELHHLLNPEK